MAPLPSDLTAELIAASVVAVPPLARNADLSINVAENRALCKHLYAGGVTSWLYGGNANFYNLGASNFESEMAAIAGIAEDISAGGGTPPLVIPSVGPDFGKMMDQAKILKRMNFATAMVLPLDFPSTAEGSSAGIRHFARAFGKKVCYVRLLRASNGPGDLAFVRACRSLCMSSLTKSGPQPRLNSS
jgi:dihydrodipicolinate synthase/N-acetylneuraminate lyase